jgi:hypothetical protein
MNNWVHLGTVPVLGIHSDRKYRAEGVGCRIAVGHGMPGPACCYCSG